jgi:DNA-binding SARP family transcriptional activator/tetratricopeptide (TPR) repeat protein
MQFSILGPLLVHDGETQVDVPKGRQRALLATLILHVGSPVAVDALTETVWDGAPPSGAEITLRTYVLRLRRALGPRAGARLVTRHPGYLLQAGREEVDALEFRRLCGDGSAALRGRTWTRADELLSQALGLWRGAALADVPSDLLLRQEAPGLEELRLQAEEWRADAGLHLGRHAELVQGLRSLTVEHPLRERFHGQLMLALYRCGRQAEALAAYQRARDALVGELGVEPGPDLRDLHQRILSADPALTIPGPQQPVDSAPRELPPMVPGFTGRWAELTTLTRLLDRPGEQAPQSIVIRGSAGVGKTTLAVHWAHQAKGQFPDGQLYVNLRGYDPGLPMPSGDALAGFLRSLGVPGQKIPPEPDQRTARYRSLLANKRMLVVLDNAGSADQVRPLLPGTPTSTVLITSRDALAGLVARDGAARLDLDILPLPDAVALLRTLIGKRTDADTEATAELARQCSRLPLALRVAAELAATRPTVPLATLVGELADLDTRLDLLAADGDPSAQVRAVFSWSYRHLGNDAARAFRLAGLHPGPDLDPYAAAALANATVLQARQALGTLTLAHLIQTAQPGRHGMHDLVRAYARELTTDDEHHAALTRLFDYYLHTAAAAMDILHPVERRNVPRPATPVPPLPDPAAARDWLDSERAVLVASTVHAADCGWPNHATRLATVLLRYLHDSGHYPEAIAICVHALAAARRIGDRAAEATALNQTAIMDAEQGRYQQAADHHRQALTLFRQMGDLEGEARALTNMGIDETQLGRYEEAARHQQEALAIRRDMGNRLGEARVLSNLGFTRRLQGSYQDAADQYQQALILFREVGDRQGEAWSLAQLGIIDLRLECYQHATKYLRPALAMFRELAHAGSEAECLIRLGEAHLGLGSHESAARNFERALVMIREIGDPILEADTLNGLGDVLCKTGETEKAHAHHAAALHLASHADAPREQARAHSGLARAYHADGDYHNARHHWQEALTRYTAIGAPEASDIRTRLAVD